MITRKIGKILRGKTTPFQIIAAAVLACMLGFVPSIRTSPGAVITLASLLIVLNANLWLALILGAGAKVLSLLLLPVSFTVGQWLIEGPTRGLFAALAEAPILAWFGFEYYATTGGLAVGLLLGAVVGVGITMLVQRFRRRMSHLEQGSEKFKTFTAKPWVKVLTFIFVGSGHGKMTYEQLMQRRIGNPIRILGVIFVALVAGLGWIASGFLDEPIVTTTVQSNLQRVHGATVDLEGAEVSLSDNRITLRGLAMADPNDLQKDLFRAATLSADLGGVDLLRKRLTVDHFIVSDAVSGAQRSSPGERFSEPAEPPREVTIPDAETLEEYLRDAQIWKDRLTQIYEWLETAAGEPEQPVDPSAPQETLRERLAREAAQLGYAFVRSDTLREEAPTLLVSLLEVGGLVAEQWGGETLDIRAEHLSTNPGLIQERPRITIASRSGMLNAEVVMASAASTENRISLMRKGMSADSLASSLVLAGSEPMLSGGTVDALIEGTFGAGGVLDMTLTATVRNSTLRIPTGDSAQVSEFILPIRVVGTVYQPRILLDDEALRTALVDAGARALADKALGEATKKIQEEVGKQLGDELGEQIGEEGGKLLEGIFGGDRKKDDN